MEDYKRELQLCILDMIKDIDKICKKHNIEYYLAYGSVLGAVRHKGFIPWDDDLDIMMKYDQYLKFLDICEKELDKSKYYVQTPEKEKNYYLSFSKIRNIKTTLIEEGNKDDDIVYGVYIDVFPLVGCPSNKFKRKKLEVARAFCLSANRNVINGKIFQTIFKIIYKILGHDKMIKYYTKRCLKYKCEECSEVVSIFDGDSFQVGLTSNEILGKPTYVDFEDTKLPIPEKYDDYLTNAYGDYMKIPSKEQIEHRTHKPYFIDLDLSYDDYKKRQAKTK